MLALCLLDRLYHGRSKLVPRGLFDQSLIDIAAWILCCGFEDHTDRVPERSSGGVFFHWRKGVELQEQRTKMEKINKCRIVIAHYRSLRLEEKGKKQSVDWKSERSKWKFIRRDLLPTCLQAVCGSVTCRFESRWGLPTITSINYIWSCGIEPDFRIEPFWCVYLYHRTVCSSRNFTTQPHKS